jgi:peptide deformylase
MTIMQIVESPDELLRQRSKDVEAFGEELRTLIDDMLETMYHENGAGLAAVQVGQLKRIFIVDISENGNEPIVFINPEIITASEKTICFREGCLSFPGGSLMIDRPEIVTVRYQDRQGAKQELTADGWLSRAIQHENDHLNGVLLIDHVSKLKADMLNKKVQKHQKQNIE